MSAPAAVTAADAGFAPLSKTTEPPFAVAHAVRLSSGASGLHATAEGPVYPHTLAALMPLVGVFDAVGPMTAILLPATASGRMPLFLRSTAPCSATCCDTALC